MSNRRNIMRLSVKIQMLLKRIAIVFPVVASLAVLVLSDDILEMLRGLSQPPT